MCHVCVFAHLCSEHVFSAHVILVKEWAARLWFIFTFKVSWQIAFTTSLGTVHKLVIKSNVNLTCQVCYRSKTDFHMKTIFDRLWKRYSHRFRVSKMKCGKMRNMNKETLEYVKLRVCGGCSILMAKICCKVSTRLGVTELFPKWASLTINFAERVLRSDNRHRRPWKILTQLVWKRLALTHESALTSGKPLYIWNASCP